MEQNQNNRVPLPKVADTKLSEIPSLEGTKINFSANVDLTEDMKKDSWTFNATLSMNFIKFIPVLRKFSLRLFYIKILAMMKNIIKP